MPHPLDPLTADEIAAAARIVHDERGLGPSARFVMIWLKEPPKETVLAYQPGEPVVHEAFVMVRDRAERATYEAVVSLTDGTVRDWQLWEGVQPPITVEEITHVEEVVRRDPRWQEALRRRGLTDVAVAVIDPWPAGYLGPEDAPGRRRLMRPLTTGFRELTPYGGGWCGNDIFPGVVSERQRDLARTLTQAMGERLRQEGYRGYFELDFLADMDSGALYLGELNPRVTGASSMTNVTAVAGVSSRQSTWTLLRRMHVVAWGRQEVEQVHLAMWGENEQTHAH